MNDAGYTLVETLVALVMVALAVGGLSAALQGIARQQNLIGHVASDTRALRNAQVALDRLLEHNGPFRSDQPTAFAGDAQTFAFACAQPAPCVVDLPAATGDVALRVRDAAGARTLRLTGEGPAHFRYVGSLGVSEAWPPAGHERQTLRGVSVVRDGPEGAAVILRTRVWTEQPVDCDFDVVLQDCR